MSEKQLTYETFIQLPRSERNVRYAELSDHDRFLARMSDTGNYNDGEKRGGWKPTQEELEELVKISRGEIEYEPPEK